MFELFITLTALAQPVEMISSVQASTLQNEQPIIQMQDISSLAPSDTVPLEMQAVGETDSLEDLKKSLQSSYNPIALQVSLDDPLYAEYFSTVSSLVGVNTSDCAKFFNRMFSLYFGKHTWGNAWEIQLKKENQKFLTLEWNVPDNELYKNNNLWYPWGYAEKRGEHFESLYTALAQEEPPVGAIGFVYRYSNYREMVGSARYILPQTHIAFLAGRSIFHFINNTEETLTLHELLDKTYGVLKPYEIEFVGKRILLDTILEPGDSFAYQDYLIEEHFLQATRGSLLEVFLRKHRNNRVDEVLRPISFSRITKDLIQSQKVQKELLDAYNLTLVKRSDFEKFSWENEEEKQHIFSVFGITRPERELFLPVKK